MSAWSTISADSQAGVLADPYLQWACATEDIHYRSAGRTAKAAERWFPIVIELASSLTAQKFASGTWDAPAGWKNWLSVPNLYACPSAGLAQARYCTARVTDRFFRELRKGSSPLKRHVRRIALGLPTSRASVPPPVADTVMISGAAEPGVVVTGVIDDGLAFAHERFRHRQGTRIEYFWNQDGGEILKRRIDKLTGDTARLGLVDEDRIYQESGHLDFRRTGHKSLARRVAHGTHVMDLACGFNSTEPPPDDLPAENRPIIGVQLPAATTGDTSGGTLAVHVLDGLRYILNRADAIARRRGSGPLPVVVNLSYSLTAGPHDGSSILECAIDDLIQCRNAFTQKQAKGASRKVGGKAASFVVVLPSGNSRQSRCHARFPLKNGHTRSLQWRVQPDDRTPSYLEIWLPEKVANNTKLRIEITPPAGPKSPFVHKDEIHVWRSPGGDVLCEVVYLTGVRRKRRRDMILVALAPTTSLDGKEDVAPSGLWTVSLQNISGSKAKGEVLLEAWIQRDDTAYGYRIRGRQSRFVDAAYEYRDDTGRIVDKDNRRSYVKRDGTVNAIATGKHTVVAGGFTRKDWLPARYSAGGARGRRGPDVMMVSDDSRVCRGLLGAGARSGRAVAMNGTSVAAPQLTAWLALQMARGSADLRGKLARLAGSQENLRQPPRLDHARGGAGRIASEQRVASSGVTVNRYDA